MKFSFYKSAVQTLMCCIVFTVMLGFNGYATVYQNPSLEKAYPIIPTPQQIEYGTENLIFKTFQISASDFTTASDGLKLFLQMKGISESSQGLKIHFVNTELSVDNPEEAYKIAIDEDVRILASTEKGAYYAVKTLEQIFRKQEQAGMFPKLKITDWPAFKIRGFMHDTGRNFQSVEQLKEQIEVLSQYKYNVFHWHLTDDPGWRLESKIYPQLQSEDATSRGKGKYYTQEDFKDIVAFCKARHITVVPEFDIPGHSQAFRKAMGFKDMKDPRALPTLLDLFDELCGLVSAEDMPYIHIGTDEVRNREEYVKDGFVKQIMDRVKSHDREVIVWMEGIEVKGDSTSINQLWAQFEPRPGHRFIDSRANYINHLDPFAGMSRLFFQQPCRQPKGDALALGGILCAWPDNNVATERDILKQNPIYPSIVFYADAIWKGRPENKLEYWAKLPAINSEDLKRFTTFEDKVIVHRDLFFKGKEFPYIRQTNCEWNVIGPFVNHNEVSKKFPIEDSLVASYNVDGKTYHWSEPKVGGTIHFKHFFDFPALTTEKTGTYYATTQIYSSDDRMQDFWVGFQGWSRSGGRRVGPFPDQGQWHTTDPKIWVNNIEIAPPVWKQPNLKTKTDEIPFIDEDYFFRTPTKIQLKKGWNTVLLKIPQDNNSWKWMFTCVPVTIEKGQAKEVRDLKFKPIFNTVPKVSLKQFPKNNQLFARDKTNHAHFEISGTVDSIADSVIVKVEGIDGEIKSDAEVTDGAFSIPVSLEALKHNYTVSLFIKKKDETEVLIKSAKNITAGDVYVLSGQSNAWAIDYDQAYTADKLPDDAQWVRTIGAMHVYNHNAIYPEAANTDWFMASGQAPDIRNGKQLVGKGMVGVLGMNLGLDLVASQDVPIAIINGAGGGGAISYYQKIENDDLDAPYGRLQYRLEASGLKDRIKAFVWNQGENNASDSVLEYKAALNHLYDDFKTDYTFEKFYVVQTPPGCNSESGHQNVREAQRQFAAAHSEVKIITRHGFHVNPKSDNKSYFLEDGCHYHAHGYEVLGRWISGLARYDFYEGGIDFEAPQPLRVERKSSRILNIVFDKPVMVQPNLTVAGTSYAINASFAINGKKIPTLSKVKTDQKHPHKVLLKFSKAAFEKGDHLNYLLQDNYPGSTTPYMGPWILDSKTGVGAIGFSMTIE